MADLLAKEASSIELASVDSMKVIFKIEDLLNNIKFK